MANVLVTGANRGIGLEIVRQLVARGDQVIAVVRSSTDELAKTGARIIDGIDVGDDASVAKLGERVGDVQLDVVINNAGILMTDSLSALDLDGVRKQLEVNALGPLRVTAALLGKLRDGGKIALVTSRMGSIADNGSGGAYGYRMSKAALNMAGVSLARDIASRKIAVVILHPGMVATDMTARFGNQSAMVRPEDAARGLVARIDELTLDKSGSFLHANGEALPW
ncbi:MAG TPA: SDR family oxidoreductase [Nannocystaceae bacterium]|nr:SDR family oxidoreductase [Nannocystaceae bacterium]